jgi:hypothetical protein
MWEDFMKPQERNSLAREEQHTRELLSVKNQVAKEKVQGGQPIHRLNKISVPDYQPKGILVKTISYLDGKITHGTFQLRTKP